MGCDQGTFTPSGNSVASGSSDNWPPTRKIRDLTPTGKPCTLEVIVTRTWEVQVSNADTFDLIIMDTNGDQIHGWIPRKIVCDHETDMYENNRVRMKGFNVIEKRKKYFSPLRNQYNIVFTGNTKVEPMLDPVRFPPQQFQFTKFADLKTMIGNKSYLSDVIGMFESVGEAKQVAATKRLRDLYIRNGSDETLKITFWNEDINLIPQTLTNGGPTPIVVVTSTSASNFGGRISVNISRGTKVLIDPDVPEAAELRNKLIVPSPGKPEKRLLTSDVVRTLRDVQTALAKGTMGFNLCRATIQQVYEDEGWKYPSCTKCRSKVTLNGNDYWCFSCKGWEQQPEDRFRLQIQISDKYGVMDATAFSETASDLLEISLEDMNALSEKPENGDEEVHNQIIKMVGKEYLFRIKIMDYNLRNPDKALTIFSVSNVVKPTSKRNRPTPSTVRALSFTDPDATAECTSIHLNSSQVFAGSQGDVLPSSTTESPDRAASVVSAAAPVSQC